MEANAIKKRFMTQAVFRTLLLISFMLGMTGCATTPNPKDASSSLIILSVEAKRAVGVNHPGVVTILRKEDGAEIPYTSQNGKYYYFANLPAGTYQIKSAAIPVNGGGSSSKSGNVTTTTSLTSINNFPFDAAIVDASTVDLKAGTVAYMGSITAEGTSKLFPPGAIEVSNVAFSTSSEDRKAALDAFRQAHKDSTWLGRL